MATGALVAISEVEVGDWVVATDPVSGVTGPREVTATWPHEDTLVDLVVSSGSVTTTEDHHFWNVTDQAWQESQHLDAGDQLLSADGTVVTVEGLDWATSHYSTAYDLTIDDLHTFYIQAGDTDVLVHNSSPCDDLASALSKGWSAPTINSAELEALWRSAPDAMLGANISPAKWQAWVDDGQRFDPATRSWSAPHVADAHIKPDGTYTYPADIPESVIAPVYLDSIAELQPGVAKYIYVVRLDGRLVYSVDGPWGHWGLAQGSDVRAAGTFIKNSDVEISVTNVSGHFAPSGPANQAEATRAFQEQADVPFYPDQYDETF